jgi:hypothetical protein
MLEPTAAQRSALGLSLVAAMLLATVDVARAEDDFTLYELLDPGSNQFAISYDTTVTNGGLGGYFFNPIRTGSVATDERVVNRGTGQEMPFEEVDGVRAKQMGMSDRVSDDAHFVMVKLPEVADAAEVRLRIYKTYKDAASYYAEGDRIVFARTLGIKANVVVLPTGYELIESSVPVLTSTLADGRAKVSMLNDRNDVLDVRLVARRQSGFVATTQEHRAEQDREITYWLNEPDTASFLISHDFTITEAGTEYVHNFVRAGSEAKDPHFWNLETGEELPVRHMTGAELNAMGVYSREVEADSGVIQARLAAPIPDGHTVRIRVQETYTDAGRYYMDGDELVWDRTLGRPRNVVTLPLGWVLTGISTPATIFTDDEGRVALRFVNPRNDAVHVVLRARRR